MLQTFDQSERALYLRYFINIDKAWCVHLFLAIIRPQVSIIPRFLTVDEGDPVEFRCSASGFPPPELAWTGGTGGRIPGDVVLSKRNAVFQIPRAKKNHEGEYFCVAKNDGSVGRMRTVLNVRGK
jgi:hypothetical protein